MRSAGNRQSREVTLAEAYGLSKAALFEDMVAERFEAARQRGLVLKIANS